MVIRLSVLHGSLAEATNTIVVGHYRGDPIVNAEKDLDVRLGGQLSRSSRLGIYPGEPETSRSFDNPRGSPPGALIVGLGEVGELTRDGLVRTLVSGLTRWALDRLPTTGALPGPASLSSLLIGSNGGTKLNVEESMTAIVQAVVEANRKLDEQQIFDQVHFREIQFVELFADVAAAAARALPRVSENAALKLRKREKVEIEPLLRRGEGGKPARPSSPYATGWNRRLEVSWKHDGGDYLEFEASTDRALSQRVRSDVQWSIVEPLLANSRRPEDSGARRGLSTYLFPRELMASPSQREVDTVLVLDPESAQIPWELLDPEQSEQERPLGSRVGILRQLRVDVPATPARARDRRALVIANPRSPLQPLPAATEEGREVAQVLQEAGYSVNPLIESERDAIIRELYQNQYDVIHIAAHGEYAENDLRRSGVVLDGSLLTSIELGKLRAVPSIVFLNCCHLAAIDQRLHLEKPSRFAASLARQLIEMGVKVVVAAGWAINDASGRLFALIFYRELLGGRTLMEAVKVARQMIYAKFGSFNNTWGAYQVYGDPGFAVPLSDERLPALVSYDDLVDRLRVICLEAKNSGGDSERLAVLKAAVLQNWKDLPKGWRNGAVLGAFGDAWGDLGEFEQAINAYGEAVASSDCLLRSVEQLCNLRVRRAVTIVKSLPEQADEEFRKATRHLEALLSIAESDERYSILGSALKRSASMRGSDDGEGRRELLKRAADTYERATDWRKKVEGFVHHYPALNEAALRVLLGDDARVQEILPLAEESLLVLEGQTPNIWNRIGLGDARLYRMLLGEGTPGDVVAEYMRAFDSGAGANTRERQSVVEHIETLASLATDGSEMQRKLLAVRDGLSKS